LDGRAVMSRRFNVLDAMILVAATAVAFAWTGVTMSELRVRSHGILPAPPVLWPWRGYFTFWWPAVVPSLMTASIAILLLDRRWSRRGWPLFDIPPGISACAMAATALAIQAALIVAKIGLAWFPAMAFGSTPGRIPSWLTVAEGQTDIGLAVIGVWLASPPSARRDAGPRWIEWSGRLLGAGWVVLFLIRRLVLYLIGV